MASFVQKFWQFAEYINFAMLWSCIVKGSRAGREAAC